MYTEQIKTTTTTEVTLNGKPIHDVLKLIVDRCHDAFYSISHFITEHEEFQFNNDIETIEGCLNNILDSLGD